MQYIAFLQRARCGHFIGVLQNGGLAYFDFRAHRAHILILYLHLLLEEGLKYFLCGAVITSGRAGDPLEWEMRLVLVVRETKCPFSKR